MSAHRQDRVLNAGDSASVAALNAADPGTGNVSTGKLQQFTPMNGSPGSHRLAIADDGPQLLRLWGPLDGQDVADANEPWRSHAQEWFARYVGRSTTRFPVVEVGGENRRNRNRHLELGVPNPMCPRGRTVRLANVITLPEHRGYGYGTLLVRDVIEWARSIDADRVDLSATQEGQGIYNKAGFVLTSAPRMKLAL